MRSRSRPVRRHAAADDQALHAGRSERLAGRVHQHVDERLLDARCDVGQLGLAGPMVRAHCRDRGLEAAELKVEAPALQARAREPDGGRRARLREPVDDRAARVAQTEHLGDLVEGLADGVVARATEARIVAGARPR
jgi:hypothetical protein